MQQLSTEKAEDLTYFSSLGVTRKLQLQQSWCHIITMLPKHIGRYHTILFGKAVCLSADLGKGEHRCQYFQKWCLNSVYFELFVCYTPLSLPPIAQSTEALAYFHSLSKAIYSLQIKTRQIEFTPQ